MLHALRKRLDKDEEGFTLIELMVVVLIIAILIAIAVPTFLGAQTRAKDRAAQSNLRTSLAAAKTMATDRDGIFASDAAGTAITATNLNAEEPSITHVAAAPAVREVQVAVTNGTLADAAEGTVSGVIFLHTKSASGKFFGMCSDYKGNVKYAQGANTARALANCTASTF